ncbi:MAG: pilin [Candidatus Nomurabacteria bacterium]|nr:pilin [Candidatus Nomurabacteria bacterium]
MKKISTIIAGLVMILGFGVAIGGSALALGPGPYTLDKTTCEKRYTACEKDPAVGGTLYGPASGASYKSNADCDLLPPMEQGACKAQGDGMSGDLMGTVTAIINTVLIVIGLISVAFLIYGGVQYTTSAGQAEKVKNAKNTIMYAIIGLVVAILAFAIVNFVLGRIK